MVSHDCNSVPGFRNGLILNHATSFGRSIRSISRNRGEDNVASNAEMIFQLEKVRKWGLIEREVRRQMENNCVFAPAGLDPTYMNLHLAMKRVMECFVQILLCHESLL
jgi:hypothetical protein